MARKVRDGSPVESLDGTEAFEVSKGDTTQWYALLSQLKTFALGSVAAEAFAATPTSANFKALLSDELGESGGLVPFYSTNTWMPAVTFATPGNLSVAYSFTPYGRYVRIGNLVHARFWLVTSTFTHTTASGALRVTGLPFTSASDASSLTSVGPLIWGGIAKATYTNVVARVNDNVNYVDFWASGSAAAAAAIGAADVPTGGTVHLQGSVSYSV